MSHHFTLHVRLTRRCNADCDYCSSWREGEHGHMSPEAFSRSIDFLLPYLSKLGFSKGLGHTISIQYVGGEILTVPPNDLKAVVFEARERFSELFDNVQDGVQSNLIGSPARLSMLSSLFGARIGTSVDTFGNSRTVSGSVAKYRTISIASADRMRRTGRATPAIFVVDSRGIGNSLPEYALAEQKGYPLTYRAVFDGGRGVDAAPPDEIAAVYGELFDAWAMKGSVLIEPHGHLMQQRLAHHGVLDNAFAFVGCPFQSNCAEVSLNLDPNGDLYICLDTSDSDQMRLGNALSGEFNWAMWEQIQSRTEHLDASCKVCPYREQCNGGCMSEGFHMTQSPFGKTGLCIVWKTIFARIDNLVAFHGKEAVGNWFGSLRRV